MLSSSSVGFVHFNQLEQMNNVFDRPMIRQFYGLFLSWCRILIPFLVAIYANEMVKQLLFLMANEKYVWNVATKSFHVRCNMRLNATTSFIWLMIKRGLCVYCNNTKKKTTKRNAKFHKYKAGGHSRKVKYMMASSVVWTWGNQTKYQSKWHNALLKQEKNAALKR